MAQQITMPKLGLTMKKGRVTKWHKKEGDYVKPGEVLFSVETDKLTNDVEATVEGTLLKIIVNKGETVPCLEPVAIIGEVGEDISSLLTEVKTEEKPKEKIEEKTVVKEERPKERIKASPVARKLATEKGIDLALVIGTGPKGRITLEDVEKYIEDKDKIKATPTAAKVAQQLDIDLAEIEKDGRIRKEDVYRFDKERKITAMVNPADERVPMNTMRQIISERMAESWHISPAVHYDIRMDISKLKEIKDELKGILDITYTDMLVKIVSHVLLQYPLLNSSVDGEDIIFRNYVNMGVAMALEDGLLVPVVKHAHIKGLEEISREIKDFSYKAKNNQLTTDEITGGTFTITNIGMFGIESFAPIINQPEVAILGVNTIVETPMVEEGNIVIKPMMNLSLTADHRVVDGAVAAQFLAKLKEYIEKPSMLLI